MKFPSKRDLWIVLVLWASVVAMMLAAIKVWQDASPPFAVIYAAVMLAAATLVLWIAYGTYYEVAGPTLKVRSGPFRFAVQLADIKDVTPSDSPLSAPAMSLDRLKITYGTASKELLVSPKDREGFLAAIGWPGKC